MMRAKRVGTESPIAEEIIRDNVTLFRHYLEKAIMVKDLVGHFQLYTREQRNELLQVSKTNQTEATRRALKMIDQLTHPSKYSHLLGVLEGADYPKLVGLLQGKLVRIHDNHRIRLNEVTSLLYRYLNPSEMLPFLLQTGVIAVEDADTIRKVETYRSRSDAALELQYILPNRHRHWYELMIWSLVESKQTDLAEQIDGSLTKDVLENETTKLPLYGHAISLQSIISAGSHEKLTDAIAYHAPQHTYIQKDDLQFGANYRNAYRSSTELEKICTTMGQLYEKLENFLENRRTNGSQCGRSKMLCRKKIERIHWKTTNLLSKLDEYLIDQESSVDQTTLKLVEAPKRQSKSVVSHSKNMGSPIVTHDDTHQRVIITDTGFPYEILGRVVSSQDRTILSPSPVNDLPARKIASQTNKIATLDRTIQSQELSANTCRKISPYMKKIASAESNIAPPDGKKQSPDLNYSSPDRKTPRSTADNKTASSAVRKTQSTNTNDLLPEKKMLYRHANVQIKLADDEHIPHITGYVLMPTSELVVCDFYNKKVKLFDQSRNISDSIRFPCAPRDLSLVDDETVTIMLPSIRRIQYVQVFPRLKAFYGIQMDLWGRETEALRKKSSQNGIV